MDTKVFRSHFSLLFYNNTTEQEYSKHRNTKILKATTANQSADVTGPQGKLTAITQLQDDLKVLVDSKNKPLGTKVIIVFPVK